MHVWSSLVGFLQPYECLDTQHTYDAPKNKLYSILYTVLCKKLSSDGQVAVLEDFSLKEQSPPCPL